MKKDLIQTLAKADIHTNQRSIDTYMLIHMYSEELFKLLSNIIADDKFQVNEYMLMTKILRLYRLRVSNPHDIMLEVSVYEVGKILGVLYGTAFMIKLSESTLDLESMVDKLNAAIVLESEMCIGYIVGKFDTFAINHTNSDLLESLFYVEVLLARLQEGLYTDNDLRNNLLYDLLDEAKTNEQVDACDAYVNLLGVRYMGLYVMDTISEGHSTEDVIDIDFYDTSNDTVAGSEMLSKDHVESPIGIGITSMSISRGVGGTPKDIELGTKDTSSLDPDVDGTTSSEVLAGALRETAGISSSDEPTSSDIRP